MIRIVSAFFFVITLNSFGQNGRMLSGQVLNDNSEPIAGASIHLLNTNAGATTDSIGKFAISSLPAGTYVIEVSAIGYALHKEELVWNQDNLSITIQIKEVATVLDDITVTAQKIEEDALAIPVSMTAISNRQVQQFRLWYNKDSNTKFAIFFPIAGKVRRKRCMYCIEMISSFVAC